MGDVAALEMVRPTTGPGLLWSPQRAKRCLFGAPNPDCTRTLLENETKRIQEDCRRRWNFDFVAGIPLKNGRYAWTPVIPDEHDNDEETAQNRREEQTLITDFMRKRKLSTSTHSNQKEKTVMTPKSKRRRRFST